MPKVDTQATAAESTAPKPMAFTPEERAKLASPRSAADETSGLAGSQKFVPPVRLDSKEPVLLATTNEGPFTNLDLSSTLKYRRPIGFTRMEFGEIMSLPREQLRNLVRDMIYEKAIYQRALKDGITAETTGIKERVARQRDQIYQRSFYQQDVEPHLKEMDDESARQVYEATKDRYTRPEQLLAQEIFFTFYKSHLTTTGETLAEIAEKESGSKSAADRILRSDMIKYPRMPAANLREQVPFYDVRPGERLLVPLPENEITSATTLATRVRERAAKGEDFNELIREYSAAPLEDKTQPFVPDYEEMLPDLKVALKKVSRETSVSEVIKSPFGLHIFKVVDYRTTSTQPFEEVKSKIKIPEDILKANRENYRKDLFDRLQKKYNVKLNTEALKRNDDQGANPLTASTEIATAPGFTYTLEQFKRDMAPTMKSWSGMTYEERVNLAKGAPLLADYIIRKESEALGLDKSEEFRKELESAEIVEIVREYQHRMAEKRSEPTEQQLREYYSKNFDKYTSGVQVKVREISRRVELALGADRKNSDIDAAKKYLSQVRGEIKSLEDFEQRARRESQALSTRSRGGLIGTVPIEFRGESFKNQLEQLKPGEISQPFLYGNEVLIVRLDSLEPSTVKPYESVRSQVHRDYMREHSKKTGEEEKEAILKEINFELKI
ncbi:MAG: peptidylprolyl isomerase [Candidatus Sumerlaeaceae bacterium]|nr:peptidylprolyl isomerase [Candidatus Sumerlaeaceae bacterium]